MQNAKKIVVLGGTGLIGKKAVALLRAKGLEAVAASPSAGIDAVTGKGLAEALAGADVVLHLTNLLSFDAQAMFDFFTQSTRNALAAGREAGVQHHVALSVVGTDGLTASPYFVAKEAQEHLLRDAGVPYTIVRATQFFDFVPAIADAGANGAAVHLPPIWFQPVAADDVAQAVVDAALAAPVNGIVDFAGPDRLRLPDLVRQLFAATGDPRVVVADGQATYFGTPVHEHSLVPLGQTGTGRTSVATWLAAQRPA